MRKRHREVKAFNINRILDDVKGVKHIPHIRAGGKRLCISRILCPDGTYSNDKDTIADVFATFYEELYRARSGDSNTCSFEESSETDPNKTWLSEIEPFTLAELEAALKLLKRGKAGDDNGLSAELLRDGTKTLRGMILAVFNDIICLQEYPPADWKSARLTVIFKKGDSALPDNYRPISI